MGSKLPTFTMFYVIIFQTFSPSEKKEWDDHQSFSYPSSCLQKLIKVLGLLTTEFKYKVENCAQLSICLAWQSLGCRCFGLVGVGAVRTESINSFG